ncbi:hypothetical protein JYU34_022515 [Plutella xylostella]|uniref:Uncharacterized protein n=1 Tax=Plutella xylostella TaxID=51655 RepID=A0ABQ7PQ20_PLUXY|nr:hypothetical protein JYU34_022515 [Plutella xylostella]
MKPPKLNPEVRSALHDLNIIKKNAYCEKKQNVMASCLSAIGKASNMTLTERHSDQELIKILRLPAHDAVSALPTLCCFRELLADLTSGLSLGSYGDTAPALRGLLYAYPCAPGAWDYDSFDRRFIRRQKDSTRSSRTVHIHQLAQAERTVVSVAAVTLPALACHIKNLNPLMSAAGAVPLVSMDTDWTIVPIESGLVGQPWLLKYLLCFTDTSLWAGKVSM